ncbi:putative inactive disease susceptibility protein LOV1 [Nicotiana tabacum]|uniref:Inactive disease susceptibility protein LOV1 n=1 Tax=Nicotiana tabacum TaxID=4097 RepID=A0A1S3Y9W1_TOBAC
MYYAPLLKVTFYLGKKQTKKYQALTTTMSELLLWLARERLRGLILAEESAPSILSVSEHLDALPGELNRLQLLLKGSNKIQQHTNGAREIEIRVRRIEYLVYRMEDVVEKSRGSSSKMGLVKGIKTMFIRDAALTLQQIRSEIELNCEQIRIAYNAVNKKEDQGQPRSSPILPQQLFGIEEDKKKVLGVTLSGVGSDIPESSSRSGSGFPESSSHSGSVIPESSSHSGSGIPESSSHSGFGIPESSSHTGSGISKSSSHSVSSILESSAHLVPGTLRSALHLVSDIPPSSSHSGSGIPESSSHSVSDIVESSSHSASCIPESSSHSVSSIPESSSHSVSCIRASSFHSVPHIPESSSHSVPNIPKSSSHSESCIPESSSHSVSYIPESSSHSVSCIPESSSHLVSCIPKSSFHSVSGIPKSSSHLVPNISESSSHSVSNIPESSSHLGVLVIPIFGVVGSGKTTLANVILNDQLVTGNFKYRIWIYVPDNCKSKDILRQIHEQIDGKNGNMLYSEEQLLEEISKSLKSQRSLIVLDDIRSIEAWKTLHITLPRLNKGSKILVTTREVSVAEYISEKHAFHNMRTLNENEGWDLFTQVFSPQYPAEEKMVMVRKMVGSCKGVPQLIKELAFYLAPKPAEEWEIVYKNIQTYVSAFFSTIYSELSDHLKPCFLHLGQFSEDAEIETEKLFHLWKIEGFLSTKERARGERMMDLMERYLKELAHINIIGLQQEEVPTEKKFKACRFIGGIKNLCVSWGEQKCFLKIVNLRENDCSLSSETLPPRLVIYQGDHELAVAYEVANNVRSLRVVGGNRKQFEMLNIKDFRVLRILDVDGINFQGQKLPGGISNLVLLRYLSVKGCVLEELPSSIGKLVHLQVLDLRVKESTEMIVIDVLWKMRKSKHLYLPSKFRTQKGEKLRLDGLKELETIENFNTRVCKVSDVSKFPKIRYLAAKIEGNFEDFKSINSYMKTSNNWFCASIDIVDLDCYSEERHSVLQEFLWCEVLQILHFKGHIGHLPPYDEISQKFTQLVLNNSHLKEDPMATLEKLPNLGRLILTDDAYMGKKMVCSASGFRQLKHLELVNLQLLEKFEVNCTAMPIVSVLKITNCERYDRVIPDCLNDRSSLHHLKIFLS